MTIAVSPPSADQLAPSLAERSYGHEEKKRGAIFTKQSVVNFMLDLIGYTADRDLTSMSLLEPSFGTGRFVLSAVDRLLESWSRQGLPVSRLRQSIRAVELDTETYREFRSALGNHLVSRGIGTQDAEMLVSAWLIHDDYLLHEFDVPFDFVIGNPPYVRQELIEPALLAMYRKKFVTMVGRADLYVAFMERSLDLLAKDGRFSFICADAWVKNDYGRGIRGKVSDSFHLAYYVDMYGIDAFDTQVGAYPSITVIERGKAAPTRVAHAKSADEDDLGALEDELRGGPPRGDSTVTILDAVRGASPWLVNATPALIVIHEMEKRWPTLAEVGCRVGIGVATGSDRSFISSFDALDVEEDRKLPLGTNKCVVDGNLSWTGQGVVNPFTDAGALVDLALYPKLSAHLNQYRGALEKRHTARSDVARRWYRTIDRITPSLTWEPKLLIPDIRGNGDAIAYDPGTLYPHHNLYFITAERWNLRALQALLRSGIAHMFVAAYSVKIGGGYLRFQAQNLRRIRLPFWEDISEADQREMIHAGESGDKLRVTLLERIYRLESGTLAFLE